MSINMRNKADIMAMKPWDRFGWIKDTDAEIKAAMNQRQWDKAINLSEKVIMVVNLWDEHLFMERAALFSKADALEGRGRDKEARHMDGSDDLNMAAKMRTLAVAIGNRTDWGKAEVKQRKEAEARRAEEKAAAGLDGYEPLEQLDWVKKRREDLRVKMDGGQLEDALSITEEILGRMNGWTIIQMYKVTTLYEKAALLFRLHRFDEAREAEATARALDVAA